MRDSDQVDNVDVSRALCLLDPNLPIDGRVYIDGDRLSHVTTTRDGRCIDASGMVVMHAAIDIHVHGSTGSRFYGHDSQLDAEIHLNRASRELATGGTCAFMATTITEDQNRQIHVLRAVEELDKTQSCEWAELLGSHAEGPVLARSLAGAHSVSAIESLDQETLSTIFDAARLTMKRMTVAPEHPLFRLARDECINRKIAMSLGHTARVFDKSQMQANGFESVTHLFNAMARLHHREESGALAALESGVPMEIIADGFMVHPQWLSLAIRLAADRIVLVSDALGSAVERTGFNGISVIRKGDKVYRSLDGAVWGTTAQLVRAIPVLRAVGVGWEQIQYLIALNGVRLLGLNEYGISAGCLANLILVDRQSGQLRASIVRGRLACCDGLGGVAS